MEYQPTTALRKLLALRKKIRDVRGSTGAGKTVGITMWDIDFAQSLPNQIIDIVSESYPHMEQGVMRDFKNIMTAQNYWQDDAWNDTKHFYTFSNKSQIHFQSYDKLGKAHGPRRDVLHLNEANYLPWDVVDQLITRTRKVVWCEYNPSVEFWMHDHMIGKRDDLESLKLTYLDNEGLGESERKEIESHRGNKAWWRVYGEGELGEVEGQVYRGWQIIDDVPFEARLERHALDFGFDPDPAAIIDIYYLNGGYILDEVLYANGLHNKDLADALKLMPKALVVADSAEPKSISELNLYDISVIPADKGPDSKRWGIEVLQGKKISMTRRSIHLIDEYRRYMLAQDVHGRFIPGKTVGRDDCLDAARYGITSITKAYTPTVEDLRNLHDTRKERMSIRSDAGL